MEVSGRRQDNKGKSSDGDGSIFCQPCSGGGDTEVAIGYCHNCNEYMCAVCLKVHRRQAMSRNHHILDGDNMPKVTLQHISLNACSDICPKHVNEIIKYYCSSHDVVGCGDCMVIDHKSCKVDRIQDISTEYFNGTEHKGIVKKVDQFVTYMDKMKKSLQSSEKNTTQAYGNAAKDVRKFKREIIDYLDKAEREMLELIAKMEKRDNKLLLKLKQEDERLYGDIRELQATLQLQHNQANKLFVEAKHVKAKLCSIEDDIEKVKKESTIDLYEFRRSSQISRIIGSCVKFGEMSKIIGDTGTVGRRRESNDKCITSNVLQTNSEETNISDMNAFFECEINIKLRDDTSDCGVRDCALISQNQIIIADNDNNCIKIVDVKNKTVSKYKLRSKPTGVAVVNPTLIAVTLPNEGQIQFLSITAGNKINERNMIKVDKGCEKITIYENMVIGMTRNSVEIMSMSGQKIKSISLPNLTWLTDIVVVPSSHMFYVSNGAVMNTGVHMFDFDGNLIATYQDKELELATSLEVTRDDNFWEEKHKTKWKILVKLCSIEDYIQVKKESTIDLYEFRRSSQISQIIHSGIKFGEMAMITSDTRAASGQEASNEESVTIIADGKYISKVSAYFDREINIKLQDDASDCFVLDCALINPNQIVVVDCVNTCIKIINVKDKTVSKYTLRSQPYGVAVGNPTLIAVTLRYQIQFLSITAGNKINERNMIKLDKGCDKITIYEDKIIGITNDSVEIMSMSGQNIKSISHPKLTWLMDIVVAPSSQMFYVSNSSSRNTGVYKLDFDGNLIATYENKELVNVNGIEVTRDGTLLVCNCNINGSIHMITPDCKKIKVLLKQNEHVRYPYCVAFCYETNKLFLVNDMSTLDSKFNNVLKVFQLK